jgi:hypothetical protein
MNHLPAPEEPPTQNFEHDAFKTPRLPLLEIASEVDDAEAAHQRFADRPNRREALCAKDPDNMTVFLAYAIAKKLYQCPCCKEYIDIGREHVILRKIQPSKRYDHHHLDFDCVHNIIIPELTSIKIINPQDATERVLDKKARRLRANRRRA